MAALSKIDIRENILRSKGKVLDILLSDKSKSTKKFTHNIIWATDSYEDIGKKYHHKQPILKELITGDGIKGKLIQPRASKTKEEQTRRTKDKAEVFTPLHIVSDMNKSLIRNLYLPEKHTWQDYISSTWLEITCGEAPFITGRYNHTSSRQTLIPVKRRVGFLDSKLQVIDKRVNDKDDWLFHADIALKACYGYEWQGDNLLIARENILMTMNDFYYEKFNKNLDIHYLEYFAEIISWNIFQMDGMKYVVPMSCKPINRIIPGELTLFGETPDIIEKDECEGCKLQQPLRHNGKYVKIMDWVENKPTKFVDLIGVL